MGIKVAPSASDGGIFHHAVQISFHRYTDDEVVVHKEGLFVPVAGHQPDGAVQVEGIFKLILLQIAKRKIRVEGF